LGELFKTHIWSNFFLPFNVAHSYASCILYVVFIYHFLLLLQQNALYCTERCLAFQCDLTKDDLQATIQVETVDVATLIFVLSAIHPEKMQKALEQIFKVLVWSICGLRYHSASTFYLKQVFRDYGLYDHAMLRFKSGNKLGKNFYVRQDGTRSFFFSRGQCKLLVFDHLSYCIEVNVLFLFSFICSSYRVLSWFVPTGRI